MRILYRMLVAPLAGVALLVALGVACGVTLEIVSDALDDLNNEHFVRVRLAQTAEAELLTVHAGAYALFTGISGLSESKVNARLKAFDTRLDEIATRLAGSGSKDDDPELSGQQKALAEDVGKYRKAIDTAIDMASMDANMGRSGMQTADDVFSVLSGKVKSLVKAESDAATRSYEHAASARRIGYAVCGVLFIGSVAVAILLSMMMARAVSDPLRATADAAARMAAGDLTQRLPEAGTDEVGTLTRAIGVMQDNLRRMLADTGRTASELAGAAQGMSRTTQDVTDNVNQQSDALSAAAASVEQLTVSITQVSDTALALTEVAGHTAETAQHGVEIVGRVSGEVRDIASAVDNGTQSLEALRASSDEISGLANVIREIADQTNLLALNAAIEAARAGESGRGFAVVADEVRKLAEKTSHATLDIKQVIERIQLQSSQAAEGMAQARSRVDAGVQSMDSLCEPLNQLEQKASESLQRMRDLSEAAREQTHNSNDIARNVENIARMAEACAGSVKDGQTAADRLSSLSRQLAEGVGRFRV